MNDQTCLIHGSYYTRNFGDLLLAELVAQAVSSRGFTPKCPYFRPDTQEQVSFINGNGLASFFKGDPLIFGGGGYISNSGGFRRALRWILPALINRISGGRYIIVGPGSDDSLDPILRPLFRLFSAFADKVVVRDEETLNVLRDTGFQGDVEITIDSALIIDESYIPKKYLDLNDSTTPLREYVVLNAPQVHRKTLEDIVIASENILVKDGGFDIVWLYENEPFNLASLTEILNAMNLNHHRVISNQHLWSVVALIKGCAALFTTQLHCGIVAYALGRPPCSLSSHVKTKRFYRQINRSQYQTDLSFGHEIINTWFQEITERSSDFYSIDMNLHKKNKLTARKNFEVINTFLDTFLQRP